MFRRWILPVLVALLLPAFAIACSGDDDDGDNAGATSVEGLEVEQTVRNVIEAYNRGDIDSFLSYWTDKGLTEQFGASRAEIVAAGPDFFAGPPLGLRGLSNTKVDGEKASSDAELMLGIALEKTRYALVNDAAWKIDGASYLKPDIPSGATKVDIELDEFAFNLDRSKLTTGNLAFDMKNVGEQAHEFVLVKTPVGFGLQQLLELGPNDDLPAGAEFVAAAGPFAPKEDGRVVLTQSLAAGTYLMLCFLPDETDPQLTPHALKGMALEFNLAAQGGN